MVKSRKMIRKIISDFYMVLILIFLYAPILTMMVLSFNQSKSRARWGGFTLDWYLQMFDSRSIMSALSTTLIIAFVSALAAAVIGTAAAIAIQSMRLVPRTIIMGITNIPMLNADIVTGISLMLSFIAFGVSLGFKTVLIAHITFNIPYVILSVMPKLKQTDKSTYEAALDLGASAGLALRKVVIPQLIPGIVSGFMLSVTLSLDDYFITTYTKPSTFDTISTYVVNATKGSHTEIKTALWALSTLIFVVIVAGVLAWNLLADRKAGAENER